MEMFFFSHTSKEQYSLIIDIQSSVVRGILVLSKVDHTQEVVWTMSIDIPYRVNTNGSYLVTMADKAIGIIADHAHVRVKENVGHATLPTSISKVHCVLSSPWIMSQAHTVTRQFDKDTKITRSYVNNLIKGERDALVQKANVTMFGIEEKIFDVRLNGYSVHEWEGNSVRSFEISFALSLASKSIIDRFTESCEKSGVHRSHVAYHSSLLLQHIGLRQSFPSKEPYILAHVHGELTDIVVASDQTCILFGSYPIGIRTVIRQLAKKMKVSQATADSSLTLFEEAHLDPLHSSTDMVHIQQVLSVWIDDCLKITSLIPAKYQPNKAIISARIHESAFRNSFSVAHPELKTEILSEDLLPKSVLFHPQTEKLRSTILYITAIHSLESL